MKVMELSTKLSSTFCTPEVIGDWQNQYDNKQPNGTGIKQNYTITFLVDYIHLYFHLGIAIEEIDLDFSKEIPKIMKKTDKYILDIQNSKLNGEKLFFTRKIFIMTNTDDLDYSTMDDRFTSLGLSLTVYNPDNEKLKIVSPVVSFTPVHEYEKEIQNGKKTIIYSSANYSIYEDNDGGVSYQYHVRFSNEDTSDAVILKDLSDLSPYRDRLYNLIHSKKMKKSYTKVYGSAIKDVFEGKQKAAIESLKIAHDRLYKQKTLRNAVICIFVGIILLSVISMLNNFALINEEKLGNVLFFSTLGSFISLFMPLTFIKSSGYYYWYEITLEIIIRFIIGIFSGVIVFLLVKSNIILGVLDLNNPYMLYLVALVGGWSEKFLPNILNKVENNLSKNENSNIT